MENLQTSTILYGCLIMSVLFGLIIHLLYKAKFDSILVENKMLKDRSDIIQTELIQERKYLNESTSKIELLNKQNTIQESNLSNLRIQLRESKDDEAYQLQKFELIANRILKAQSANLNTQQQASLKMILDPLQVKIKHFEEKVEYTNKESLQRHASLREQIIGLADLNKQMSKEALDLTRALKGDNKQQGDWGEMILESILVKSGLEEGREFTRQTSMRNDEGKLYKPDYIISLPDGKKIIIDSKVSLSAYNRFINEVSEEQTNIHLKAHTLSVRNHVEQLANKQYHDLYHIESPDFVLMFISIDTAFSSALKFDNSLYEYAYHKNVIIVTPATLLATLKTVETLWRNDKQQRNALEIAVEAGKMYDKLVGFVTDLEKVGSQLDTVKNSYNDTMKKLSYGKGDLISRAESLKKLGAKTNKTFNTKVVSMAKSVSGM